MNHEFYGPTWADNHARLGDTVARGFTALAGAIGKPLERLQAYQFAAPWRQRRRGVRLPAID